MALTATGIGSGLDINTIVGVLVDAEKVPKEAIFDKTEKTIELNTLKEKTGLSKSAWDKGLKGLTKASLAKVSKVNDVLIVAVV